MRPVSTHSIFEESPPASSTAVRRSSQIWLLMDGTPNLWPGRSLIELMSESLATQMLAVLQPSSRSGVPSAPGATIVNCVPCDAARIGVVMSMRANWREPPISCGAASAGVATVTNLTVTPSFSREDFTSSV